MNAVRVSSVAKKKSKEQGVPATTLTGQPCLKCDGKCVGGYVPHQWRKKCVTCGCSRDWHQPLSQHDFPYLRELGLDSASQDDKRRVYIKYAWYPSGIDSELVERYMSCLPKNCQPIKGSKAEQQREESFKHQHPLHDASAEFCHDEISDLEKKRMLKFSERRIRNCFGVGKVIVMSNADKSCKCHGCSGPIPPDSVVVSAEERMDENNLWHPGCFRCGTCMELLADLIYFYSKEKNEIYCGRHHGETVLPRCNDCDELIFSGTYTEALGKNWHKYHFCCASCQLELHGKKHRVENEKLLCAECYGKEVACNCEKCRELIGLESKMVTVEGKYYWHRECFVCTRCKESLAGQRYYKTDDNNLLCSDCQGDHSPIAQCQGCKNAVSSTTAYVKHKQHCWHPECFKCTICRAFLASGEYHDVDDNPMCMDCYSTKISRKCANCQEPITKKGVQHGLSVYHSDCFNCSNCDANLVNESKVKEKDGRLICHECYLKTAKKCFHCKAPITSRHTVYKNRLFHIECFKCNLCGSNIEGGDFYETSLSEILCAKCAHIN